MDAYKESFREEAYELLAELEESLLNLEEKPDDMNLVGRVFRAMHTVKGSGSMFGFEDIATFTHNIETVYDLVRSGVIPVTKEIISLSLSACDQIKMMVEGKEAEKEVVKNIIISFETLIPEGLRNENRVYDNERVKKIEDADSEEKTYRIRFKPSRDILSTGTNPARLLDEIRELGRSRIIVRTRDIPVIDEIDPEACYLYWDIILTTADSEDAIRDVFIFVEVDSEIDITIINIDEHDSQDYKKLGEILIERGDLSTKDLKQALDRQKRLGEILVDSKIVDTGAIKSALEEQKLVKQVRKEKEKEKEAKASSIRVGSEKLDTLVDLVGELVTVQARLSQFNSRIDSAELLSISEEVERLAVELRDNTMSIRMLPIGTTFNKFKRLVRDLSDDLGKDVVLTTTGGDTELDKTVIEQLSDPMVHIIRNCIDHGIEMPDIREKSGKSKQGRVRLSAEHSGGNVLIKISDDGTGLDTEAIRKKAMENGISPSDGELSEKEVFALIFEPGFSTAEKVTDVSGRGVGMDVVKRNIESLRGSIGVNSVKGNGTTITLKLPLTLAIIDGLLVDVGNDNYVLPLSAVEECVELNPEESNRARERNMIRFRGKVVPYLNLRDMFGINGDRPTIEQVVIAESNIGMVGLGVDRLIGQNQTVIKTLSKVYKNVDGLSGATILGDGSVALILDVSQIVQSAQCDNYSSGKSLKQNFNKLN